MQAPQDYANPRAGVVSIAVYRVRATDRSKVIGSLLVDPGGPGGGGKPLVTGFARIRPYASALQRFDLIGFDPRGVWASTPRLACMPSDELMTRLGRSPARPQVGSGVAHALAEGRDYAQSCQAKSAAILPFVGTKYVAFDMDRIRQALGAEQISYFGLSYGTVLGNVYADLFPHRLRATVLDGAVDPHAWRDAPLDLLGAGTEAAEAALGRFLSWCAATSTCPFGHGNPARAFDALVTKLDKPALTADGKPALNAAALLSGVSVALGGGTLGWPPLARALAKVEASDRAALPLSAGLPDVGDGIISDLLNLAASNVSIECTDFAGTITPQTFSGYARHVSRTAPRLGPAITFGPPLYDNANGATCAQWLVHQPPSRHTGDYHAHGAAPVLVVGTTGDPSTPYAGAVAQAKTIEQARLLTFQGEGHTAFFRSACVARYIVRYLLDPHTLPPEGTTCTDNPAPQG